MLHFSGISRRVPAISLYLNTCSLRVPSERFNVWVFRSVTAVSKDANLIFQIFRSYDIARGLSHVSISNAI
jgi:hypothetical protein